jgi:streptogramin lyase
VLVTSTTREAVAGSDFEFDDRGIYELKGIPGQWHLYAVLAANGEPIPEPLGPAEAARRRQAISVPPARRHRALFVTVAVLVVAALVTTLILTRRSPSAARPASNAPAPGILEMDPTDGKILGEVRGEFGGASYSHRRLIVAGEGAVWTTTQAQGVKIDPKTLRTTRLSVEGPGCVDGIAVGNGAVWFLCTTDSIVRMDVGTLKVSRTIPITFSYGDSTGFVAGYGAVWAAAAPAVLHLYPSGAYVKIGHPADALALGDRTVWLADSFNGLLTPFDPATGRPGTPLHITGNVTDLAAGPGQLWVLDGTAQTVTEIDPRTGNIIGSPIHVSASPTSRIATGLGAAWVSGGQTRVVTRIDSVTQSPTTFPLPLPVANLAVDTLHQVVWVLTTAKANRYSGAA